ncbi:hypothetical protein [Streptomyces sp. YIM 98790]|uniref:hypothetical protein n=1 Tax=Streptomyces sp. YIM 98790 TaxID=2689077 RepID=UPI00140DE23D|nr:hypothetical protein [Streptomyces sp. YIM 98790]
MTGRRKTRVNAGPWVTALAGAVLMAGCSAPVTDQATGGADADAVPPDETAWPSAERTGLVRGMVLPLEYYLVAYPDEVAVDRARWPVIRDCMAEFGFDFELYPPGSLPPLSINVANMERRYGLADADVAASRGYQTRDYDRPEPAPEDISEEEALVLFGGLGRPDDKSPSDLSHDGLPLPEGGCLGEADRLTGALDDDLASRLSMESFSRSLEDSRVQAALGEWSRCMAEHGYQVDRVDDVFDEIPWIDGRLSEAEITLAVADVGCKESTGLVQTWFDVEAGLQEADIAEHHLALEEARENNARVMRDAANAASQD